MDCLFQFTQACDNFRPATFSGISWISRISRLNFLRQRPVARGDWLGDSVEIDVLQYNEFGRRPLRREKSRSGRISLGILHGHGLGIENKKGGRRDRVPRSATDFESVEGHIAGLIEKDGGARIGG